VVRERDPAQREADRAVYRGWPGVTGQCTGAGRARQGSVPGLAWRDRLFGRRTSALATRAGLIARGTGAAFGER